MIASTAHYPTAQGSQYLQQLCKHFAHKVDVDYDATRGHALLPSGELWLRADETGLTVRLEAADAKSLIQARYTIDSHLVTFAFREGFTGMRWEIDA